MRTRAHAFYSLLNDQVGAGLCRVRSRWLETLRTFWGSCSRLYRSRFLRALRIFFPLTLIFRGRSVVVSPARLALLESSRTLATSTKDFSVQSSCRIAPGVLWHLSICSFHPFSHEIHTRLQCDEQPLQTRFSPRFMTASSGLVWGQLEYFKEKSSSSGKSSRARFVGED